MTVCKKCGSAERTKRGDDCVACARERTRQWDLLHAEQRRAYHASYKKQNKTKKKEQDSQYSKTHRPQRRIVLQNYRSRKRASGGKLSIGLVDKLLVLQRGLCACGCQQKLGNQYELDHRMPISLGGEHADHNMQLLTRTCNRQKRAQHPVDFMQSRGFLL